MRCLVDHFNTNFNNIVREHKIITQFKKNSSLKMRKMKIILIGAAGNYKLNFMYICVCMCIYTYLN